MFCTLSDCWPTCTFFGAGVDERRARQFPDLQSASRRLCGVCVLWCRQWRMVCSSGRDNVAFVYSWMWLRMISATLEAKSCNTHSQFALCLYCPDPRLLTGQCSWGPWVAMAKWCSRASSGCRNSPRTCEVWWRARSTKRRLTEIPIRIWSIYVFYILISWISVYKDERWEFIYKYCCIVLWGYDGRWQACGWQNILG